MLYDKVDVTVIGASLSGSSLALHLAKRGLSVLLCDKDSFPRRKACGEGLSVLGLRELDSLGLQGRLLSLPHEPFHGFRFFESKIDRKTKISDLSIDVVHGIGIQRYILDQLLIDSLAKSPNAIIMLGGEVNVEERYDGQFVVSTEKGIFQSKYLVLATGAQSKLPQKFGVPTDTGKDLRCGIRIDLAVDPSSSNLDRVVSIVSDKDMQACCTRVAPGLINVSCMTHQSNAKMFRRASLDSLTQKIMDIAGIQGVVCQSPLAVANIGKFERIPHIRNIFVIGDAIKQLDPIGGMGMTQALISGRVTAESLINIFTKSHSEAEMVNDRHNKKIAQTLRIANAYTQLSSWSLVSRVGKPTIGRLKTGSIARQALLGMHERSSWNHPAGMLSALLIYYAGFI